MNILDKLKMVKDDPMWADHSEITKKTLGQAIDEIERLRAQAKRHEAEKAELRATRARYAASLDAIYAAWHGAGVDLAGGNWQRFVGMLPPLYTAPPAQAVSVPFDIEEYLSTYEWRAEDGGLSELTARDRQLLQDFANGLPLYTAPPAQAVSGNWEEAHKIIGRLMSSDPSFEDCTEAADFIRRIAADQSGPDGFATWKDAAIAERVKRVAAEKAQVVSVPNGSYQLTLSKHEVEALADYHDYVQEDAYSCGSECEGNKLRAAELRVMLAAAPSPEQKK